MSEAHSCGARVKRVRSAQAVGRSHSMREPKAVRPPLDPRRAAPPRPCLASHPRSRRRRRPHCRVPPAGSPGCKAKISGLGLGICRAVQEVQSQGARRARAPRSRRAPRCPSSYGAQSRRRATRERRERRERGGRASRSRPPSALLRGRYPRCRLA
eukprot:scaffold71750_cov30-Tisochrysis_lutea.AAC.7